jgi:flagellar motor switch protein FliM
MTDDYEAMEGDVLSQAEVESLLAAIERPEAQRRSGAQMHAKTMPYDFKRPERVGKEQMRSLQTMYEGFSRNFGAALSALLRAIVEVKLTSVDQLTYSEFVFSLENPTCFNIIQAEPLEGHLILDINPSILYLIIDRLLGGGRETAEMTRRPLTEIELRLVARVTDLFLREMKHSWEHIMEINAHVDRVESNPQLAQIVSPNEVVVLISFELMIGESRGMMNFCIPFNAIERISNKLAANNWSTISKRPPTPESIHKITTGISGAVVEVVAELAQTRITTGDLIGLRVGDIITTEKDVREPLAIKVEGRQKLCGAAGAYKGRKAIQIVMD